MNDVMALVLSAIIVVVPFYLFWRLLNYYDVHYNPRTEYIRKAVREMIRNCIVYKK